MATKTFTLACTADARLREPNQGAGASSALPVGLASGADYRSILKFAMPNWSGEGIRRITAAKVRLFHSTQVYVARGSSPRVKVWRVLSNWSEGSADGLSSSNAVRWDNMPTRTASEEADSGTLSTSDTATIDIGILTMARKWAPTSVESGGGQTHYGVLLVAYDEASTTRTDEFWSSEYGTSGKRPVLILTVETNTAPGAPTITAPKTNESGSADLAPATAVGTARNVHFTGSRNDPDAGDYVTKVEIAIHSDSATDASPGSALISRTIAVAGAPTSYGVDVDVHTLSIGTGTAYRYRARTYDREGVVGPWSSLVDGRFTPNTRPAYAANRAVDSGTQTPNFYGSLVDPDPNASLAAVRIVVIQDVAGGGTLTKWDQWVDVAGGTRFAVAYAGSTLEVGQRYRCAVDVRDNAGAESGLAPYVEWTVGEITGPDNMTPRNIESKVNSLQPVLTIGHSSAFTAHDLQVARYSDGTGLLAYVLNNTHASTTSRAVTYGTEFAQPNPDAQSGWSSLDWCRTYWWRSRVLVGGVNWTPWSPWYPFRTNCVPTASPISVTP